MVPQEKQYIVQYNHEHPAANQAIAVKRKGTGDILPLFGWSLLEPIEEVDEGPSGLIEVVELEERPVTQGVVSFDSPGLKELGVHKGDIVGFKKNRDYRIRIDGKEYYRVALTELLYKV